MYAARRAARSLGGGSGAVLCLSNFTRLLRRILGVICAGFSWRCCWRFDLLPLDDVENESANIARAVDFTELSVEKLRVAKKPVFESIISIHSTTNHKTLHKK